MINSISEVCLWFFAVEGIISGLFALICLRDLWVNRHVRPLTVESNPIETESPGSIERRFITLTIRGETYTAICDVDDHTGLARALIGWAEDPDLDITPDDVAAIIAKFDLAA